jgi:alpha-glucosidase
VVNVTSGGDITRYFPASWNSDGSQISWTSTGPFELYLMPAASLDLGTRAYYALTGQPRVPPRYAFGFFASRWGWTDRAYIESMLHQFRAGMFPIDSFISDFEWFTNESDYNFGSTGQPWYDDFGFNSVTFPDPVNQLKSYHTDLHVHMGGIRKPRLGNTAILAMAKAAGYLLPGGELESQVGYAEGRNLNYTQQTRDWYAKQEAPLLAAGVDFFWNDEGETDYFTFHWWNEAQLATLRLTDKTKRFFSINRAWSPGMARLGATVWTGDINPNWGDMQSTTGMILNWGLAGGPYVACDIGGFSGDTQADLLARWFQVGVFMPVMRVHSTLSATPHFPFLWPEPYQSAMRLALNLRYQLIPYHYSLAQTMYSTGALWMRPLVFDFPSDSKAAGLTSQWLDGALLVAPVLTQDSNKNVYLPAGTWYTFNTSQTTQGPTTIQGSAGVNEIPVFTRPGAVIPLAPVIQYADALPGGALEVQVYAGADGQFSLIEDDGATTAYESGAVRTTVFKWNDASRTLAWVVSGQSAPVANEFVSVYATLFSAKGVQHSSTATIGSSGSLSF